MAASRPAALTVDLGDGGARRLIHKVETIFANNRTVYKNRLQGSTDVYKWTNLANRSKYGTPGAPSPTCSTSRVCATSGW